MSDSPVTDAAGWYGKLPGLGDFATRRLPLRFVSKWDEWISAGLQCARESQGPDWLDGYLVAPIRRFWLAADVVDEQAWAGLLMPSVDRVGRCFPLTVAQPMAALAQVLSAREWIGGIDAAMRATLKQDGRPDDLERELSRVPAAQDGDAMSTFLANGLLQHTAAACSVWWCDGAFELADFSVFSGLPPPQTFARLQWELALREAAP
jgi:type VI secretion system protein ImpM